MAAIRLQAFQGLAPIVAPELLQDMGAQVATNCDLDSGNIIPLHEGVATYTTAVSGTIKSIFRINDTAGEAWLAWATAVNCIKGPITGLGRYFYTGDGVPKATTHALATSGSGYPYAYRPIGLPAPVTAPSVSPSSGVGAAVSRYYVYTFYDDWDQESAISPLTAMITGKVDDTWAVTAMDATPPNSGDINALTYSSVNVTITTTNTHFNRVGDKVVIAGVTTVTNVNGTWTLTAVNIASKTMTFAVNTAPAGTYVNGTDTTDTWTRQAPFGTCTKRLYRTSGSTSQFQLVAEGISATTYDDTITDANIPGDELISSDWDMPPVDLDGLFLHPSGSLGGFSGNELCFSEPYQPHAWPASYRLRTDYPIVATAVYGESVAVATSGAPYTCYGSEPGQMALTQHNAPYPCLSKRSMVSTLTGTVYSSPTGLVQMDNSGAQVISSGMYSKDQWDTMQPDTMFAAVVDGKLYYAVTPYDTVAEALETTRILIFSGKHTIAEIAATALYADQQDGKLYYVIGSIIYAFDQPSTQYLSQDWHSKEIVLPEPRTLTAAKIQFDSVLSAAETTLTQEEYDAALIANTALITAGDAGGWVNEFTLDGMALNEDDIVTLVSPSNAVNEVSFRLYADGALKYSKSVTDEKPFRLPSGYRAGRYSVRVISTCRVKAIELADNVVELKGV